MCFGSLLVGNVLPFFASFSLFGLVGLGLILDYFQFWFATLFFLWPLLHPELLWYLVPKIEQIVVLLLFSPLSLDIFLQFLVWLLVFFINFFSCWFWLISCRFCCWFFFFLARFAPVSLLLFAVLLFLVYFLLFWVWYLAIFCCLWVNLLLFHLNLLLFWVLICYFFFFYKIVWDNGS